MATLSIEPHGASMKRVAAASYAGSAIEYYDFYIYGSATLASMATFAAAFLSRPLGAAFFGHFGDRLGRKSTLIATLLIMGLSTLTVGLVPGAVTIGMAAPLILLTLRLVQGFAVGGEWPGSRTTTLCITGQAPRCCPPNTRPPRHAAATECSPRWASAVGSS